MKTPPATVGIAVDNYKRAALYFDTVIPVHRRPRTDEGLRLLEARGIPHEFLPPGFLLDDESQRIRSLGRSSEQDIDLSPFVFSRIPTVTMNSIRKKARLKANPLWHEQDPLYQRALLSGIQRLMLDVQRLGLRAVPILDYDWIGLNSPSGFEVISVVTSNIADVDVSGVSWEHIRDFRQDPASVAALRRYRNFWLDNFEGLSRPAIEDQLALKFADFVRSCRKHDLEIVDSSIVAVLSSKSLLATGAVSLASALAGVPNTLEAVGEVLAAGFAIELGQLAMSLRRSLRSRADWRHTSELMYLQRLRDVQ